MEPRVEDLGKDPDYGLAYGNQQRHKVEFR
jgi:hypothetical protein